METDRHVEDSKVMVKSCYALQPLYCISVTVMLLVAYFDQTTHYRTPYKASNNKNHMLVTDNESKHRA